MVEPDNTAVRTALWRALHVEIDGPPPVLDDRLGLQLVAPDDTWRERPDMDPDATRGFRASIVARARFVEDVVAERVAAGVTQYVILGAGLDTFAERRPDLGAVLRTFEIDQPGTQAWKRRRLDEVGIGVPDWLRLVPIDFESGASWWDGLVGAGFDPGRQAVVASTGVSMYLTKETTAATLRQLATLEPGSTLVMSFLTPIELVDAPDRDGLEVSSRGARRGHAVRELLHTRRDRGDGHGRRLRRRPPRAGEGAGGALLRRPGRRPATVERRGPHRRHDLTPPTFRSGWWSHRRPPSGPKRVVRRGASSRRCRRARRRWRSTSARPRRRGRRS